MSDADELLNEIPDAPSPVNTLSLSDILSADVNPKAVHIPQWGGWVRISKVSAGAMGRLEEWRLAQGETPPPDSTYKFMCLYLSVCLVDEGGQLLFNSDDAVDALMDKPVEIIESLFLECRKWNGWKPEEEAQAGN